MAEYRDMTIENQKLVLDGNTFTGVTFRNCQLILHGDGSGGFVSACIHDNCTFFLDGPARAVAIWMQDFYHEVRGGGSNC